MVKKVSSKNQQGGITAGEVNIGSSPMNRKDDKNQRVPAWLTIAGIVFGIIGATVALLTYID